MTADEKLWASATEAERKRCLEICARMANMIVALGINGDAVTMANDIAAAIREGATDPLEVVA